MTHEVQKIIIDLTGPTGAKEFSYEQSFFQKEIQAAVEKIKAQVAYAEKIQKEGRPADELLSPDIPHYHEALSILGPRGIGKTSFLMTLRKYIRDYEEALGGLHKKLFFLPVIDHGMLEDAEYLLPTLTSLICHQIWDYLDCVNADSLQDILPQWTTHLQELCDGFIAIDRDTYRKHMAESFLNPEIMGRQALMNGCSGILLYKKFRDFVAKSLKVLSKLHKCTYACMVLRIDDVDTIYERSWGILENIRKYLSCEQIILVTAGDQKLFQIVIRNHLLEQSKTTNMALEKGLITDEDVRIFKDVEQQYLLKLFPLQNRISLPSPQGVLLSTPDAYQCIFTDDSGTKKELPFKDFFAEIMVNVFKYPEGVKNTETPLPLNRTTPYTCLVPDTNRGLLQFLQLCLDGFSGKPFFPLFLKYYQNIAEELKTDSRNDGAEFFKNLSPGKALAVICQKLVAKWADDDRLEIFLLQPRHDASKEDNLWLLLCNAILCHAFSKKPCLVFEFWLTCLYPALSRKNLPKELAQSITTILKQQNYFSGSSPDTAGSIIQAFHRVGLRHTDYYRRGLGFLRILHGREEFWRSYYVKMEHNPGLQPWQNALSGIIDQRRTDAGFSSEFSKIKPGSLIEDILPDTVSFLKRTDDISQKILRVFLVFVIDASNESVYVDFFRGITFLATLLHEASTKHDFSKDATENSLELIKGIVGNCLRNHLSRTRYFEIKGAASPSNDDNGLDPTERGPERSNPEVAGHDFKISQDLEDALAVWVNTEFRQFLCTFTVMQQGADGDTGDNLSYPLETFAYIWRNTLETVHALTMAGQAEDLTAGQLLNQSAKAFLLSILMEEKRLNEKATEPLVNIQDNVGGSHEKVFETLKRCVTKSLGLNHKLPLFFFWLNCPLISTLLTSKEIDDLKQIISASAHQDSKADPDKTAAQQDNKTDPGKAATVCFQPFIYPCTIILPSLSQEPQKLPCSIKGDVRLPAYDILCALIPARHSGALAAAEENKAGQLRNLFKFFKFTEFMDIDALYADPAAAESTGSDTNPKPPADPDTTKKPSQG
ncbi:hypothetical protein LJC71_00180 [Desulfosarcina sp. OttesenSCG-928-A07]|nr:hypothetical protein [Desulfosarcina sp. OttesenSCG-928-G17]MDL2328156.1 hypothetical protein [Desulfosarcina sp. OttesenSCG-928-A07]